MCSTMNDECGAAWDTEMTESEAKSIKSINKAIAMSCDDDDGESSPKELTVDDEVDETAEKLREPVKVALDKAMENAVGAEQDYCDDEVAWDKISSLIEETVDTAPERAEAIRAAAAETMDNAMHAASMVITETLEAAILERVLAVTEVAEAKYEEALCKEQRLQEELERKEDAACMARCAAEDAEDAEEECEKRAETARRSYFMRAIKSWQWLRTMRARM